MFIDTNVIFSVTLLFSVPETLNLNRQVISILNQLGVPCSEFLALQEKYLSRSVEAMFDEELAWKELRRLAIINQQSMKQHKLSPCADKLCMRLLQAQLKHKTSKKQRNNAFGL